VIAVVPARGGSLVAGSEETVAEAGGVALVAGDGAAEAAAGLAERSSVARAGDECRELRVLELGASFRPAQWARAIAPHLAAEEVVVLPASPDGRDLAPRLAALLERPLFAGAIRVTEDGASLAWRQGRQVAHFHAEGPFVATLLPGSRSALASAQSPGDADTGWPDGDTGRSSAGDTGRYGAVPSVVLLSPRGAGGNGAAAAVLSANDVSDPDLLEVMPADPAVMDLAEAERIVAAGYGVGGAEQLAMLEMVAAKLGASVGATRVVTDAGWIGHERQIGTTGVSVRPRCYLAFGISGAAQHIGGLGSPRRIVSVNLDRSCPMMAMADLALVTDAQALIEVLARRLGDHTGDSS
jgi:electron transfer flavoprotein alpha subunit